MQLKYHKQKGKIKHLNKWNLSELIKVAKAVGWLPHGLELKDTWSQYKAKIGRYAEVVRYMRNLIHPARYIDEMFGKCITNKHLEVAFDTVHIINDLIYIIGLYSILIRNLRNNKLKNIFKYLILSISIISH